MDIINLLLKTFFNFSRACQHDKILPNLESAYCPDCGRLVRNEWYIVKCACCGMKLKARRHNGEIIPHFHYCTNCGASEYVVEKLDQVNFLNVNYAVLIKNVIMDENPKVFTTQCWQEKRVEQPKLLVQYL